MNKKMFKKAAKQIGYPIMALYLASAPIEESKSQGLTEIFNSNKETYPVETKVSKFKNYHPESQETKFLGISFNKKTDIEDKLLEQNLKYGLSKDCFRPLIWRNTNSKGTEDCKIRESQNLEIENPKRFKKAIYKTAKELMREDSTISKILPDGTKSIEDLSIHNAVLLSGKITAHRLRYDEEIVGYNDSANIDTTNAQKEYISFFNNAIAGRDIRTKKARKVDNMPIDRVFYQRDAVCRHYAPINSAIFNVLKEENQDLGNTYMTTYEPKEIGHLFSLSHEWNKVNTLNKEKDTLKVKTTHVDPTWLDTRNQTADNSGEESNLPPIDIYNAYDTSHFGKNKFFIDKYVADRYSELSKNRDEKWSRFQIREEKIKNYKNKSLDRRLSMLEKLAKAEKQTKPDEKIYISQGFYSLMKSMAENQGSSYDALHGNYGKIPEETYERTKEVYESIKKATPKTTSEKIWVLQGSHPEEKNYTTIEELFRNFKESQENKF